MFELTEIQGVFFFIYFFSVFYAYKEMDVACTHLYKMLFRKLGSEL